MKRYLVITLAVLLLIITAATCEGVPSPSPEADQSPVVVVQTVLVVVTATPEAKVAEVGTPTSPPPAATATAATTPTLALTPTPQPTATPPPPPAGETAQTFLKAWEQAQYGVMYGLLSSKSREEIDEEKFVGRYRSIAAEATISSLSTGIKAVEGQGDQATAVYTVTMQTFLVGQIDQENVLPLILEDNVWKVQWSPQLIFSQLTGSNLIHLFFQAPTRANIYDRRGQILATQGALVTVGVVPGQIQDEEKLLNELSRILDMDREAVKARYENAGRPDWFMPVKDLTLEELRGHEGPLSSIPGVLMRQKEIRAYPYETLAAQTLGYMSEINAEELGQLAEQGYQPGDPLGKVGLERWGEPYLAGRRGGLLTVITPEGDIVTRIKDRPPALGRALHTTLDLALQQAVEEILGDKRGAIVALDPRNGEILAMVSHPAYDPNEMTRGLTTEQWQTLLDDKQRPLVNRVTQALYPVGSVFKIVTMAAGMEKAGLTRDTPYVCEGVWYGLGQDWPKHDWKEGGHGPITLFQGLVQSCDIVFYEIGKQLYEMDRALFPEFVRSVGLGERTGLEEVDEAAGFVPGPDNQVWFAGDAVNLAIGQGDMLATPLQVAQLLAAVANGGTRYRPRLVQRIGSSPEEEETVRPPEELGKLPVSPANLQVIREALAEATRDPHGTSRSALRGMAVPVAGKTGTAEHVGKEPHAWFAGYAPADAPRLVVVVIVEEGGEGSKVAAPLFRKVVEAWLGLGE